MHTYALNTRCQLKTLWFTLVQIALATGYVLYDIQKESVYTILMSVSIPFIIFVGPSLYLYFTYLYHSAGVKVTIDPATNLITVEKNNKAQTFDFSEVSQVTKVCSYPVGEGRPKHLSSDYFFYYRLQMKDDAPIIITALMSYDLALPGNEVKVVKRMMPVI